MSAVRHALLIQPAAFCVALVLLPSLCGAQGERPRYQSARFEEDWSRLRDRSQHTDAWDAWKYLGLENGWFLTLAGELRERYELLDRPAFGAGPPDSTGYLLQRVLFSVDAHAGKRLRVFAELQTALVHGRAGGPRATDLNRLDVHQAFADLVVPKLRPGSLTIRIGRQEVAIGAGRLISAAEGLNVRRSFDGVRAIYQRGAWAWNTTALRLVKPDAGFFNDKPDAALTLWGSGVSRALPVLKGASVTAYYVGLARDHAVFSEGAGRALRHTVGARVAAIAPRWDFNHEIILQRGMFEGRAIRAWGLSADAGVSVSTAFRPRLGLRADVASGDRRTGDGELNSFDPLFPSAIAYSGSSGLLGPTNLADLTPSVRLTPRRGVLLSVAVPLYWRLSEHDALYAITTVPFETTGRSTRRFVGINPEILLMWQIDPHASLNAMYSRFRLGPVLRDTTAGQNVHYLSTSFTYKF